MPPFPNKNTFFYKKVSKVNPPATPKSTRNHKKMVSKALKKHVFFSCFPDPTNLLENDSKMKHEPNDF